MLGQRWVHEQSGSEHTQEKRRYHGGVVVFGAMCQIVALRAAEKKIGHLQSFCNILVVNYGLPDVGTASVKKRNN